MFSMTIPRTGLAALASMFLALGGLVALSAAAHAAPDDKPAESKPSDAKPERPRATKPPLDIAATRPAPVEVDRAAAVARANEWFNKADTMVGDFIQVGPDGRRSEGKIYVQRPGKLRFEYAQPATMEIVADGTSLVIRDRKLATQDNYFLAQTPLKFLLKDNIDLGKDVKVQAVTGDNATTSIAVEDKATFGGTSHIRLTFDNKSFALKQWKVTDPQGYDTLVSLYNLDLNKKPDPSLFKITQERFLNPN